MKIGFYSNTPRSGKSAVADLFLRDGLFLKESFAHSVKIACLSVLNDLHVSEPIEYLWGAKKGKIIPELGRTGGQFMSEYAMFMRNTYDQDIWLNTVLNRIHPHRNYIIDDLRFPNEFSIFDLTVKVERPSAEKEHGRDKTSEGQLDNFNFDYIIVNDGTLVELEEKVAVLYKVITGEEL